MKSIRIGKDVHSRLKVACAKRGVSLKDATEEAIRRLLARWEQEEQDA